MRKILLPIIILLASSIAFAQGAFVDAQTANLRGTPSATGKLIDTLSVDTEVFIIAKDEGWYLVQAPEFIGWVSQKLIRLEGEDESDIPQLIYFHKAKVSAKSAVLKGAGSNDSAKTADLPVGTQLEIVAHVDEWFLVQTASYSGWILEDFVTEVIPQTTTAKLSPADGTLFETEDSDTESVPRIRVKNDARETLELTFGGIKYVISSGKSRVLEIPEGKYQYTAAGGGATPYTRVEYFEKGKIYGVTFYVK